MQQSQIVPQSSLPASPTGVPLQSQFSAGGEANIAAFQFSSLLARIGTSMPCIVRAVTPGGIAGPSTVNVQPLVHQVDGDGNVVPHGIIHGVPVFRLQAGGNAVVLDPAVGDIGLCVVANRDISAVAATRAPAQPGSGRRFDFADSMFFGGFLNGRATQYVIFDASGIKLVSPVRVTLEAPMIAVTGDLTATGSITAGLGGSDQVGLQTHNHGGPPPTPGS